MRGLRVLSQVITKNRKTQMGFGSPVSGVATPSRFRPALECLEDRIDPAPLSPLSFSSLGVLNPVTPGDYTIDTTGPNPVLRDPATNILFTGVISGGVAVFDFSSVTIANGITVNVTGPNAAAILSRTSMTIDGTISSVGVSAMDFDAIDPFAPPQPNAGGAGGFAGGVGNANPDGNGEDNGFAGSGPGGGAGNQGGVGDTLTGRLANGVGGAGGGGFGRAGAVGASAPDGATGQTDSGGAGGAAYGNLFQNLQGGSGGGGANATGGGGGGGAIELGAITRLTLSANGIVDVHGGSGAVGNTAGSGGGAGGGVLLHARVIDFSGEIDAYGGDGGVGPTVDDIATGGGGGGGGGRIYVLAATSFTNNGIMNLQGGNSNSADPGNLDFGIPPDTFGPGVRSSEPTGGNGVFIQLAAANPRIVRLAYPGRYTFDATTGIYSGYVTIYNSGPDLSGPFTLTFIRLPPGVTLLNATGTTTVDFGNLFGGASPFPPLGTPFILLNTNLPHNTAVRIYVQFTNPLHSSLSTFYYGTYYLSLIFGTLG